MTKQQFWVLHFIAVLLTVLLITQFILGVGNGKLINEVNTQQTQVNNARQLEPVLDQLAKRIARDSETNPDLRNLLVKHDLHVTLDVNGKPKNYP